MRGNRVRIKILEETGYVMQTFRVPKAADWQERQTRKVYHAANVGRKIEGLPRKTYYMIDKKGRRVAVE